MQSPEAPPPSLSCGAVPVRATPLAREAVLCAAAAAFLASLLVWLGPPGADFAAHAYQRSAFLHNGFALWNNFWYAGRYSFITYSVIYYPLAALIGIKLLAVATVATAALAFTVVLRHEWGAAARWSSWTFAVVWSCIVVSGAFPFALGAALALLSIWALQTGSRWKFGALAALTLAASPLAFLLLSFVLTGIGVARWREGRKFLVPAAIIVAWRRSFPRSKSRSRPDPCRSRSTPSAFAGSGIDTSLTGGGCGGTLTRAGAGSPDQSSPASTSPWASLPSGPSIRARSRKPKARASHSRAAGPSS